MRAAIFTLTKQVLHEGVVRCYGRGLLWTYLRIKCRHNAREDDVRDALATLDIPGKESRRKGPDKDRKGGEFIALARVKVEGEGKRKGTGDQCSQLPTRGLSTP